MMRTSAFRIAEGLGNVRHGVGTGHKRRVPSVRLYPLVERFFNKLKHFRAIATRYDKLARNFLAGVHLASTMILLN
jgi:transposase